MGRKSQLAQYCADGPLTPKGRIEREQAASRSSEAQIKHPGTKQVSRPDLLYELDNGWKLGETKFSSTLEGKKFTRSSPEYERLQKYAALIEDGVVYQGKRIKRIKIVFSSEEFAKVNYDIMKDLFDENFDIFYIANNLTEVKL